MYISLNSVINNLLAYNNYNTISMKPVHTLPPPFS